MCWTNMPLNTLAYASHESNTDSESAWRRFNDSRLRGFMQIRYGLHVGAEEKLLSRLNRRIRSRYGGSTFGFSSGVREWNDRTSERRKEDGVPSGARDVEELGDGLSGREVK